MFLDDDNPRETPRTGWPVAPSLITETSKGKYHYYWLTSTTNFEEWEKVEEALVHTYEGDTAVKDIPRILRLPTSINSKNGFSTKVVSSSGTIYEWKDLVKAFPPLPETERPEPSTKSNFLYMETMQAFIEGKSIAPSMNSLIAHHANHGHGKQKIRDNIDYLFKQVTPETYKAHSQRYENARAQIDKFINSAKKNIKPKVVQIQSKKAKPLDSKNYVDFTPIPKECLPDSLYLAASEVSRLLGNGIEPAIISGLSISCALLSKNVRINEIGEDKQTFCSSGIIVAMSTGTRKTEIFKQMNKPFVDYERLLQKEWEETKFDTQAVEEDIKLEIKQLEKNIATLAKKGVSRTAPERKNLITKKGRLYKELDSLQLAKPLLYTKDVTETKVVSKMLENQGAMAIVSDDSRNIIKNILGRYDKAGGTSEGFIIDGINGGQVIKLHRVGQKDDSPELEVNDPCLNVYLMVQPDMANKLRTNEMYLSSGLAARVPIYYYPVDALDIVKNSDRKRRLDQNLMEDYYQRLKRLCVKRPDSPLIVNLTESAEDVFNRFNTEYYNLLISHWHGEYNRTNKMITQAVIYSTVIASIDDPAFAIALQASPDLGMTYELNAKYANMGCMYVKALYDGMVKSTASMHKVSSCDDARKFALALIRCYDEQKIWEGFVNTTHLINSFSVINKDNRLEVIDILKEVNWLVTSTATKEDVGDLNNGFPAGKVRVGDTIYHLNYDEVKLMLRKQYEWSKEFEGKEAVDPYTERVLYQNGLE